MGQQSTTPSQRLRICLRIALALVFALHALCGLAQTRTASDPLLLPSALVYDAQGNLYIAETASHRVSKLDVAGDLTTVAGDGVQGFSGDGGPATAAALDSPQGLALDNNQHLYITDTHNQRIRRVSLNTGIITTVAGTGVAGFSGDSGQAAAARLDLPTALATDGAGNLFLADTRNHRIRRVDAATGIITTVAGDGVQGCAGDGGPATAASIDSPAGMAVDSGGNLYIADTHNQRVRRVAAGTGTITTIAGTGVAGFSGDNAAAAGTKMALPRGLTLDAAGNVYVADMANHRIRRIDAATGAITTVAGNGTQTFAGDGGTATAASLDLPRAAAVSPNGLVTLADTASQRVRQVYAGTPAIIQTIAGLGASAPAALTLTAPPVTTYGTGQIAATLAGSAPASGVVSFVDTSGGAATPIGTAALVGNTATLAAGTLPVGTHTITASYAGDATHGSAQTSFTLTVAPQPVTATVAPISLLYGQPIPPIVGTVTGVLPQDSATIQIAYATAATSTSPPGIYPVTVNMTGTAAGNYALLATPSVLTIAKAPATIVLTASATTIVPGSPVAITASVATTTSGMPSGTIVLLDGSTMLASLPMTASGQATFTTTALAVGSHTLTASYSGDADFLPVASAPAIIGVGSISGTGGGQDFTLAASGETTQTVAAGHSASFVFALQMQGAALSSPVALSATGIPAFATASFNPAYLPPGSANSTFTLTIATAGASARRDIPASGIAFALLFPLGGLAFVRRRRLAVFVAVGLVGAALTLCTGCGDRIRTASSGTSAATPYAITVTGTATTPAGDILEHSVTVTLLLQPAS